MDSTKNWSHGFELLDIEVIPQSKVNEIKTEKWDCDYCSLYFLDEAKLNDHKRKHINTKDENVRCQYCNKPLFVTESSRECYNNRKCETCEYKCSKCPKRFLRHSSLQNHEKNHLRLSSNHKKTVLNNSKTVNSVQVTNKDMKVSKKRQSQLIDDVAEETVDERGKISNKTAIIPKKKSKIDSLKKSFTDETMVDNSNSTKRTSLRSFKQAQQDKPAIIENNKQNRKTAEKEKPVAPLKIKPTTGGATTPIAPIKDNTVNYKPFSCHVCGDTFASDNSLLDHIRSHGESAAKRFKCKHCGDEFDDIYKMQYHLAICPLAEDELECTFQNNIIPPRFIKKEPNTETSPTVKRGRPRKDRSLTSQNSKGEINNICTPLINTSDGFKKKLTDTKLVNKNHNVTKSPTPKKILRRSLNRNVTDKDLDNDRYDANSGDFTEDPRPNEENQHGDSFEFSDTEKKRGYLCPFPGCTIKCSREKALLCHMKNHEDFEESMKCHKCGTTLDDVQSLRLHMNECKGYGEDKDDDSNDDDYRDKSFKSTSKQSAGHYQRHRGQFNCSICGRSYSTQQRLDRHLALHRSSNYTCRVCQEVFINQQLLDVHYSMKHPTKSPYHCPICREDFISELFLQIHESEYHGNHAGSNGTATVATEDCHQSKTPENFCKKIKMQKRYNYTNSSGSYRQLWKDKTQCVCPICFAKFSDKESIRVHFRESHIFKTNSSYICCLCETEKPNAEMLCYHFEVHSDNLLSVNRFSELRSFMIDRRSNKISDQSFSLDVVKSEPISDKEEYNEWVPEIKKEKKTGKRRSLRKQSSKTEPSNSDTTLIRFKTGGNDVSLQTGNENRVLRRSTFANIEKQQVSIYSKKSSNKEVKMKSTEDDLHEFPQPPNKKVINVLSKKYKKKKSKGKNKERRRVSKRKKITKKSLHNDSDSDGIGKQKKNISNPEILPINSEKLDLVKVGALQTDGTLRKGTSEINEDPHPVDDGADECMKETHEVSHTVSSAPHEPETLDPLSAVHNSQGAIDNEQSAEVQSAVVSQIEEEKKQSDSDEQQVEGGALFSSSGEDEPSEEISCTMCSLSFYNQDDLLDHVTTHI